jgi:hypothetical protein
MRTEVVEFNGEPRKIIVVRQGSTTGFTILLPEDALKVPKDTKNVDDQPHEVANIETNGIVLSQLGEVEIGELRIILKAVFSAGCEYGKIVQTPVVGQLSAGG